MSRTLYTNFRWWKSGEAQQMLVENERVIARSAEAADADAEIVDLGGKTMLPKFIDAHCHILPTGFDLRKLHLGQAQSHEDVLDMLRDRHASHPDGWLVAVHYDQNKYAGGHITRHQLDAISSTRPIFLGHVNGHASVANTAALKAAGVDDTTDDPAGGMYGRDCSGKLEGTLFEAAHEHVQRAQPKATIDEMVDAILLAGETMSALGIGCATDMMTGRYDLQQELRAYRMAADRGCKIKMRLYLQWREVFGPRALPLRETQELIRSVEDDKLKVCGIKIFSDGGISSGTAAIYGRYLGATPNPVEKSLRARDDRETSGQLMYSPERLTQMAKIASDAGYQVAIHAIGDYAADLVMDVFEATGDPARHRMEHGMILSDAQIERFAKLGSFLTFQPEFLMRIGPSYFRQLGPERASMLKRSRSVIDAGIRLSFNSDRPIVAGDPMDGIRTATHRPEGFDPRENCTWDEAVEAYTIEGARVNGDANEMGALLPGQFADFQLQD